MCQLCYILKIEHIIFIDNFIKNKIRHLNDALDGDPVDVELLRKMMITNEGAVTDDIRCKVWPKLLNIDIFNKPKKKRGNHFILYNSSQANVTIEYDNRTTE